MRAIGIGAILLVLCLAMSAETVVAQKYGKSWDPMAVQRGEYLADEDFNKLSFEEGASYCQAMQEALDSKKKRFQNIGTEKDRYQTEVSRLRKQVANLDEQIGDLKSAVAAMERKYGPYRNKAFSHTVVRGEYLSMIAAYDQIYGDTMKWPRLYRANRDQIEDPDLIYPDQDLKVPHGYPQYHLVVQDEFLSKIANYWEIYDDGREWPRIYEANKDQIRDPDLVYPDLVLTIPR